ncbi:hypothetical protein COX67_01570 [Candidatus Falkowbacteria bacterium CG_4_10_14_0_2_um_filter_36_22]|uniref:histidine kinase n=1 Tax=Candidatus Falkowbacteria bacterium CG02_land_8_20_14_3_00_36_14 TaxID=1974560 RepID=A0A2M7DP89_9BACT|nr:MAG: hypothetical protein COS18_02560 [Candidatus Falkowbacteria bacterium CG02_land_8_20_14_3_00_36_14]PIX11274.1 MAG: hypothetical protein COZ73_03090 [Candidatus Falkowbacteria bacterium CG_4_8_14_3_um_filter_36_11]PJA11106.1 MAG: hypothetical protein COX67_01570 [Candidatus Falkowbacteria bacterium CG_4_10_14_0_2_um_filter_36_22]
MEILRNIILIIGWPILILGSILFIYQSYNFYKKTQKLALGKLVVLETFGHLLSMYLLGFLSTYIMFINLGKGVIIVLPIFLVWIVVMVIVYQVSKKWEEEAAKINILFYKIKERTEQLLQEKNKLTHIAQNMSTGAILLDNIGQVMFINNEAKNIVGFSSENEEEILGALFQKFSKHKLKERVSRCIAGHPSNLIDVEVDNRIYEIFLRCLIDHKSGSRDIFGHFVWIRDVTEEKLLERTKYKFIAVASHKLRTPLTSIRGFVELLLEDKKGKLNADQKQWLDNINKSSKIMVDLVNKLLKASEIQSVNLKIDLSRVQIDKIIEEIIKKLEPMANNKNCIIKFNFPKDEIINTETDGNLFSHVVESVIRNAIIYSLPERFNDIEVEITNDKSKEYIISVKDRGIGMPEEAKTKIFHKFFRAENALLTDTEEAGISMSAAQVIMKALGGRIWFNSKEGEGTTFYISIPIK